MPAGIATDRGEAGREGGAIFGAADAVVAPPDRPRGRCTIVRDCGHLGLLYDPAVLAQVAAFGAPAEERPAVAGALAAA